MSDAPPVLTKGGCVICEFAKQHAFIVGLVVVMVGFYFYKKYQNKDEK